MNNVFEIERDELDLEIAEGVHERPTKCVLQNWAFIPFGKLYGDVKGHPRLGDQNGVITSKVQIMDHLERWAVTRNTFYILEEKSRV